MRLTSAHFRKKLIASVSSISGSKTIKRHCAYVASMESCTCGMNALDGKFHAKVTDPVVVGKAGDVVVADGCSMHKFSFIPESQSFPVVASSREFDEFEEAEKVKEMSKILGCEFEDHEALVHKHIMGIEAREARYKQSLRQKGTAGEDLGQPES